MIESAHIVFPICSKRFGLCRTWVGMFIISVLIMFYSILWILISKVAFCGSHGFKSPGTSGPIPCFLGHRSGFMRRGFQWVCPKRLGGLFWGSCGRSKRCSSVWHFQAYLQVERLHPPLSSHLLNRPSFALGLEIPDLFGRNLQISSPGWNVFPWSVFADAWSACSSLR